MPKIGDSVWRFDLNSRVYTDDKGQKTSGPYWPAYWTEHIITGETRVSWILDGTEGASPSHQIKIPKAPKERWITSPCFSKEEVAVRFWWECSRHEIVRKLERIGIVDDPGLCLMLAEKLGVDTKIPAIKTHEDFYAGYRSYAQRRNG